MAKKRRKTRPRKPAPHQPLAEIEQELTPATAGVKAKPRRPRQIEDQRPPAPWGSFPLVEIVVLVALVMLGAGLFVDGPQGSTLLVTGVALGSLAGLELSLREHLAGYRSHSTLLAGAAGIATLAIISYGVGDSVSVAARAGIAVAVGGLAAIGLVRVFRARSGRSIKLK